MAVKPKPATTEEILLKADSVTLNLTADKEGRIRLNCGSWDAPKVILPGQRFEVRWRDGQAVLLRRVPG